MPLAPSSAEWIAGVFGYDTARRPVVLTNGWGKKSVSREIDFGQTVAWLAAQAKSATRSVPKGVDPQGFAPFVRPGPDIKMSWHGHTG